MDYNEYLKSKDWQKLRTRALKRANYKCEFCGTVAKMIHHVEYLKKENSEIENINHLIACCRKCHDLSHGIRNDKPIIKNLGQKLTDTINFCLRLKINSDIMNALAKNHDFLEFNRKKKLRILEEIKKKPYREMSNIIETNL
ncbi:HNH endonuclease [Candidatus Woesearchaeota archaeon]|nr:HNH endonuclease [Candidatus Woesearchaeota archaeon]